MKFKNYGEQEYTRVKFQVAIGLIFSLILSISLVKITNISKMLLYVNDSWIAFMVLIYFNYSAYRNYSTSIEFLPESLEIHTKNKEISLKYILKYSDIKNVYVKENTIFIEKNNTEKFLLAKNITEQDSEKLKSLFNHLNEYGLPFDEQHINAVLKNHLNQEKKKSKKIYVLVPLAIVIISFLLIFIYKNY